MKKVTQSIFHGALACFGFFGVLKAAPDFFELPPIKYSETASQDAVTELIKGDWITPPVKKKVYSGLRTGASKETLKILFETLPSFSKD